jgi:hypothetical protein
MTVAVVLVRTNQLTTVEEWRLSNGAADAVLLDAWGAVRGRRIGPVADADLPPGSRVVSFQSAPRLLRAADGPPVSADITNLPVADPLVAGTVRITGRAPERASEVVLSEPTAKKLGVGVGDAVDLERPIDARVTVVGLGAPYGTHGADLVVHRDVPFPEGSSVESTWTHLVDLPAGMTPAEVKAWASLPGHQLAPGLDAQVDPGRPVRQQSAPIR